MATKFDTEALVREAEWRKCQADVVHWANHFVQVVALGAGGRCLMNTSNRPYQEEGLRMLADPSQRRIITLKSRQVGWTTTCAVAALWWVLFHADQYVLFISRREDDARTFFTRRTMRTGGCRTGCASGRPSGLTRPCSE